MTHTISAIILTKNEEKNIVKCLLSVSWCDEIIVVDDYSNDRTIEKINHFRSTIKIFQRCLNGEFAIQRNFGLSKVSSEWVLFIDADEVVSDELQSEIRGITQNCAKAQNCDGYYIKRQDYFLGQWLKHGEVGNIKLLKLAKKDAGRWVGNVHEVWAIKGKTEELKNPLWHYPHPTIISFLAKINLYTDILAKEWYKEGKSVHLWSIILYPTGKFIQNYLLRFGFLDGIPGLIMAMMMSFHSFLARGKLWFLTQNHEKTS